MAKYSSTKLLLIRSPKYYHVSWVFTIFSREKRFYINRYPNPDHNPEAIHNPNHNPYPTLTLNNWCLTSLSRDQNRFFAHNSQRKHFYL